MDGNTPPPPQNFCFIRCLTLGLLSSCKPSWIGALSKGLRSRFFPADAKVSSTLLQFFYPKLVEYNWVYSIAKRQKNLIFLTILISQPLQLPQDWISLNGSFCLRKQSQKAKTEDSHGFIASQSFWRIKFFKILP